MNQNYVSPSKCLHKNCLTCVEIGASHIFEGLPVAALEKINLSKSTQSYKRGQVVFYAGNAPLGLFCINSGVIRLESTSAEGDVNLLRIMHEGALLGYRALVSNEPYHASAIVHEDSEVCLIPQETFFKLAAEFPALMMKVMARLSVELREAESRIESMTYKEAPERVAEAVLFFKEQFPDQTWTRKEISEWAGTTPETVMRVLAKIEEQGLIEQKGRVITILNRKKLIELAKLPLS